MPPGDVTIARKRDRVAVLGEHCGGADEQLPNERIGDRSGQSGEHPGVDQRLGDQEEVGGAAAHQAR